MPRTSFSPSVHGFHFDNDFVNVITQDITTRGRCGGMAFAALDCYFAGVPIPSLKTSDFPGTGVPPDGHPVSNYIYFRLIHSWMPNGLTFIAWTQALDHQTLLRGPGVIRLTKQQEIPKLCAQIDAGVPVPLGLVVAGPEDYLLTRIGDNHQVVAYGYEKRGNIIDIYVYDNNYADEEICLSTDMFDMGSYVTATKGGTWRGLFVESYSYIFPAALVSNQSDWRWCHNCSGLFWGAGEMQIGKCPAGGQHERGNSGDYTLVHNSPGATGQNDWRWCYKCCGLFWSAGQLSSGKCPAGGPHEKGVSGDYTLPHNVPNAVGQKDWRYCAKCNGLFWAGGHAASGACPSGAQHDRGNSGEYTLMHTATS